MKLGLCGGPFWRDRSVVCLLSWNDFIMVGENEEYGDGIV